MKEFITKHISRILAILIILVLYALTVPDKLDRNEKEEFRKEFSFIPSVLYKPVNEVTENVRSVHPQYENISAWISSVGAAVTFADLDNDRKYDDLIHVDPRYDKVFVSNASDKNKYLPFHLEPSPLRYDKATMSPMGTLTNDFNEDGLNDILVYYWGRTPVLYLASGYGFKAFELSPVQERWYTNAATCDDFDGDGHLDILICNYFPDGSRVLDEKADDKDQVMQHSMSRADNGSLNHLFLFDPLTKTFIESKDWYKDLEKPLDWTLAVASADIDGDGLSDIYIANDFGPDKLLINGSSPGNLKFHQLKGKKKLTTISSSVLGKDSFKGMGADFGDINGDGLLDIYISNIAAEYALEESHFAFICNGEFDDMKNGIAPYENESEKLGLSRSSWGWDSKLADLNNDGVLEALQATGFIKGKIDRWPELQELAMGNDELLAIPEVWPRFQPGDDLSGHEPNPFFVRDENGRFHDIAYLIGVDERQVTRGIATADYDQDGDLDYVVANQWEDSRIYTNQYNGDKNFLAIIPVLSYDNIDQIQVNPDQSYKGRIATSCMVRFTLEGKKRIDYADGGNGHSGVDSPEIYFGLDNSNQKHIEITINWRDLNGIAKEEKLSVPAGRSIIYLP